MQVLTGNEIKEKARRQRTVVQARTSISPIRGANIPGLSPAELIVAAQRQPSPPRAAAAAEEDAPATGAGEQKEDEEISVDGISPTRAIIKAQIHQRLEHLGQDPFSMDVYLHVSPNGSLPTGPRPSLSEQQQATLAALSGAVFSAAEVSPAIRVIQSNNGFSQKIVASIAEVSMAKDQQSKVYDPGGSLSS